MSRVLYYFACIIIAIGFICEQLGQGIMFSYLPDIIPFVPNKLWLVIIGFVVILIGAVLMGLAYYLQSRKEG